MRIVDGCEAVGPLKTAGDVVSDPVVLDHDVLKLGEAPGLGTAVDSEALARYRRDG